MEVLDSLLSVVRRCCEGFPDKRTGTNSQYTMADIGGSIGISCVGRAVDPVQAIARMKRSPKRMANCALAMHHSRAGMVHSFSDRFKTRNSSFRAASSVGK